jgi:hypothetical protein
MLKTLIPDAQKYQLQAVQTRNIGTRASFVGTAGVYEDPIAHVLRFVCSVSNLSVSIMQIYY